MDRGQFHDRVEAGRRLADRLAGSVGPDSVVLGLPRGGVPVAAQVAHAIGAPLDVLVVRKLGVPGQPEVAMGAVGERDVRVLNPDVLALARIDDDELARVTAAERAEVDRRALLFRHGRPVTDVHGRTAVVVDDGVATGATARAACQVARAYGAAKVVFAAPVAAPQAIAGLSQVADDVVCVLTPRHLHAVGEWYDDFRQTADEEVVALLDAGEAERRPEAEPRPAAGPAVREVTIPVGSVHLPGTLTLPPDPIGVVLFAHGSGSSRFSPRNRQVAADLHRHRLGTLLFDLLTGDEETDRRAVFDVPLLAHRLNGATAWWRGQPEAATVPVGYFGASTGAAAALWAAAEPGNGVRAVVSRGGRPDLAAPRLSAVTAPTLLIVGGHDEEVLALNQAAAAMLTCPHEVAVVPGATHLFVEPGTLEQVGSLAAAWFDRHLVGTNG